MSILSETNGITFFIFFNQLHLDGTKKINKQKTLNKPFDLIDYGQAKITLANLINIL